MNLSTKFDIFQSSFEFISFLGEIFVEKSVQTSLGWFEYWLTPVFHVALNEQVFGGDLPLNVLSSPRRSFELV